MKIETGTQWSPSPTPAPVRPGPSAGGPTFGRVLDTLRQSNSVAGAPPAPCSEAPRLPEESAALVGMEDCLNLLDRYREGLSQSRFRLVDLEPLVEALETGLPSLEDRCATLPENSGLRPLLHDIMVLSATETARFRRGDYQDA